MRAARISLVAAVAAAATAVVIAALPAGAADAPTPPYDVFTMASNADNAVYNTDKGAVVITGEGSTITAAIVDSAVTVHVVNSAHDIAIQFAPILGQALTVGTYPIQYDATAANAGFRLSGVSPPEAWICYPDSGSITVTELVRDPGTQALTAFAASYSDVCSGRTRSGEVRWHSGVGYTARTLSSADVSFGDADLQETSAAQTMTVTSRGTTPVQFGQASLTGEQQAVFAIVSDGPVDIPIARFAPDEVSALASHIANHLRLAH